MTDLVLYDGICGLCNRFIQFILARDTAGRFRYAPLQGAVARDLLARRGHDAADLDTVYVVEDYQGRGERLLLRGEAVTHVLRSLGGVWSVAVLGRLLPLRIRDALYDFVARHRYRWFGRFDSCPVPSAEVRGRFL